MTEENIRDWRKFAKEAVTHGRATVPYDGYGGIQGGRFVPKGWVTPGGGRTTSISEAREWAAWIDKQIQSNIISGLIG